MQLAVWTAGLFIFACLSSAVPFLDQQQAHLSPHRARQASTSEPHRSTPADALPRGDGLDIDLNLLPPVEEHLAPQRGGRDRITGSMVRGLQGWGHRLERTPREHVPEPSQNGILSSEADYQDEQGDGKRLRRIASLDQRSGQPSNPSTQEAVPQPIQRPRIMQPRHAKGKSVAIAESSSSGESSDADDDTSASLSDHSKGKKRFRFSTASSSSNLKNSSRSRSVSTSSLSKHDQKRKELAEMSTWRRRKAEKDLFYQEWNKINFNTKITPKDMAAKVVSLRVDGLEDREIGWYAAAAIKDQAGLKYYGEYTRHLSNLRLSVRRLNAKLAKEGRLNAKDPKAKMLYVLNKALNRRRQGPRLGEISRRPSLAAKIDAQLEDIEEATRAHLSAKGIDFDKATKVEVEEGTRDINPKKYGWMGSKSSFVEGIYALLKSKKRATDADISSYLLARRTKRFQARNRRRLVNRQRQREAKETDDEL